MPIFARTTAMIPESRPSGSPQIGPASNPKFGGGTAEEIVALPTARWSSLVFSFIFIESVFITLSASGRPPRKSILLICCLALSSTARMASLTIPSIRWGPTASFVAERCILGLVMWILALWLIVAGLRTSWLSPATDPGGTERDGRARPLLPPFLQPFGLVGLHHLYVACTVVTWLIAAIYYFVALDIVVDNSAEEIEVANFSFLWALLPVAVMMVALQFGTRCSSGVMVNLLSSALTPHGAVAALHRQEVTDACSGWKWRRIWWEILDSLASRFYSATGKESRESTDRRPSGRGPPNETQSSDWDPAFQQRRRSSRLLSSCFDLGRSGDVKLRGSHGVNHFHDLPPGSPHGGIRWSGTAEGSSSRAGWSFRLRSRKHPVLASERSALQRPLLVDIVDHLRLSPGDDVATIEEAVFESWLGPRRQVPEPRRRLVTIVFAQVDAYRAATRALPPDDVFTALHQWFCRIDRMLPHLRVSKYQTIDGERATTQPRRVSAPPGPTLTFPPPLTSPLLNLRDLHCRRQLGGALPGRPCHRGSSGCVRHGRAG